MYVMLLGGCEVVKMVWQIVNLVCKEGFGVVVCSLIEDFVDWVEVECFDLVWVILDGWVVILFFDIEEFIVFDE